MKKKIKLRIAFLNIELSNFPIDFLPSNAERFLSEFNNPDLEYVFTITDKIEVNFQNSIFHNQDLIVVKEGNLERRYLFFPECNDCYAYYREESAFRIAVQLKEKYLSDLRVDAIFISILALERHFCKHNAFILHCSYLEYNKQAILFSGPSGIGKSTQSNLWVENYPSNSTILNGDRCLLTFEDGIFYANGWPMCGSSRVCINKKVPVSTLILLGQDNENKIIETRPIIYVKRILSQLTVNYWDKDTIGKAILFAETLLQHVGCCVFHCNISSESVHKIHDFLIQKRWIY